MAKEYDKVFRENFEEIVRNTSSLILNLDFKVIEGIGTTELPKTIERKVDFAKIVEDQNGFRFVLHLEFQTEDDPEMVIRMLIYKAWIQERHRLPLRQYVLYLGREKSEMITELQKYIPGEDIPFRYKLVQMMDFSTEELLKSIVPEEVILTILTDLSGKDQEAVIERIFERLKDVCKTKRQLTKCLVQLRILSNLRSLDNVVLKILKKMPIVDINIEEDAFYKEGEQIGERKGERKGQLRMQNELAIRLLKRGKDTISEISEITGLVISEVEKLKASLEDSQNHD